VPVQPPPPAEGPINIPVRPRPATMLATPSPAQQPAVGPAASVAPAAVAPPVKQPAPPAQKHSTSPAPPPPGATTTTHGNPPSPTAVWVNTESHVYHKPGSRHYGKTRAGKYLTEQEAIAEGDRPAREWVPAASPRP
jgi:hypothetical protein